jgi:hypothetical protein
MLFEYGKNDWMIKDIKKILIFIDTLNRINYRFQLILLLRWVISWTFTILTNRSCYPIVKRCYNDESKWWDKRNLEH